MYRAKRIGRHGVPFVMYKFRTMRDEPGPASTSENDPRITKIGRFLRRWKIDELPQLWNVVKRDMNIVGPRPECPEVMEEMILKYPSEYDIIVSVRPGITDLATLWNSHEERLLKGESDPHNAYLEKIWPEKRRLQIEYVTNRSLWLDLTIIFKTIAKLFR